MYKNLFLFLFLFLQFAFGQTVVINEVVASNEITIYDDDGEASDWIELYNSGSEQINLQGYFLSDDTLDIQKWQFNSFVINPGEYLIVFASDKNRETTYAHTNFKISASGESIILSNPEGVQIDRVNLPKLETDISYARISDASLPWTFQIPSPGSENTGEEPASYADNVEVSLPGGFYSSSISLELTAGDSKIFYTLDSNDPDQNSSEYSGPINIQNTTVLKAISYKEDHLPSPITCNTYFINEETDLPVISLVSDPFNLYDPDYGIYTNFEMDLEQPAHVEFFEDDKNPGFSENCGIEIYGGYTQSLPQKSFAIKFKDPYNNSSLEYPLFPDFDVTTFKSFILRNSGNDFQFTHIRDAMMQTLIKDLDIDYLEYRPATTYLNGNYWGIYNIREKISEHYIANRHGVDPDNIDMLESNMEVLHGDASHYQSLIDYISTNDMSTDEAYNYVNSMIDVDNCLLYFAAQVYYNNQDWPANNIKYWREKSETGKWRWIIYDLDFGFNLYETTGQSEDHVNYLFSGIETRPGSNPPWSTLLPRKLVENPAIKNKFINLVADLLNKNFKSARVIDLINSMMDHIESEIHKHRERWELNEWTASDHLNRMIKFAQERPSNLRNFMRDFFHCGEDGSLKIYSNAGGKIQVNSLELTSNEFPWSGVYFQDNTVHVKAIPNPGYKFTGWSGDVQTTNESLSFNITRSTELTANFSPDGGSAENIVINEINYNSSESFDSGDWIELYNPTDEEINIGGWYFSDSDDAHKFYFPSETILGVNQYIVLVENENAFTSLFPDVNNYISEVGFGLSGSGEFMKIVDTNGQIIDSLTYDDKTPWPEEPDGNGATLELFDALLDNSLGENWRASTGNGTPGKVNSVVSSVEDPGDENIPEMFTLYQNYPNPFNPTTRITYSTSQMSHVTITVYDLIGREISTLINEQKPAGFYSVEFDASNLSSGVYFYQMKTSESTQIKKMVLLQ